MRVLHTEEPHGPEATPEEIVRELRQGEQLIAEGKSIVDVVKAFGVSDHTYSRWRNQYGGLKADDAKELGRLKDENARLRRMVADRDIDIEILKEAARGNW